MQVNNSSSANQQNSMFLPLLSLETKFWHATFFFYSPSMQRFRQASAINYRFMCMFQIEKLHLIPIKKFDISVIISGLRRLILTIALCARCNNNFAEFMVFESNSSKTVKIINNGIYTLKTTREREIDRKKRNRLANRLRKEHGSRFQVYCHIQKHLRLIIETSAWPMNGTEA